MLPEQKQKLLQELISSSTPEELIWITGYLNGVINNPTITSGQVAVPPVKVAVPMVLKRAMQKDWPLILPPRQK